jgi:uncharacterized membrane protein
MKKYLTAGFITLLPIALTIFIVSYCLDFFTDPLFGVMESILLSYEKSQGLSPLPHDTLVTFLSRLFALILMFLLILLLGFLGRKFFFKALLNFAQKIVMRIPVIGAIYRLTKDITKVMLSTDQQSFKKTVLVPFPTEKTHTLGFVTGDVPENLKKIVQDAEITVFVPTAPHPISGYVLLAPKKGVYDVDISVEDSFKFLVSCGVIYPPKTPAPRAE